MFPSSVETRLAKHGIRLNTLEDSTKRVEAKIDRLFYWLLGAFASATGGLLVALFKHAG